MVRSYPVAVGIPVCEQAALKHFIWRSFYAWNERAGEKVACSTSAK